MFGDIHVNKNTHPELLDVCAKCRTLLEQGVSSVQIRTALKTEKGYSESHAYSFIKVSRRCFDSRGTLLPLFNGYSFEQLVRISRLTDDEVRSGTACGELHPGLNLPELKVYIAQVKSCR